MKLYGSLGVETGREWRDYSDLRDSPELGCLVVPDCCISALFRVECGPPSSVRTLTGGPGENEVTVIDFTPTAEADGLILHTADCLLRTAHCQLETEDCQLNPATPVNPVPVPPSPGTPHLRSPPLPDPATPLRLPGAADWVDRARPR